VVRLKKRSFLLAFLYTEDRKFEIGSSKGKYWKCSSTRKWRRIFSM